MSENVEIYGIEYFDRLMEYKGLVFGYATLEMSNPYFEYCFKTDPRNAYKWKCEDCPYKNLCNRGEYILKTYPAVIDGENVIVRMENKLLKLPRKNIHHEINEVTA